MNWIPTRFRLIEELRPIENSLTQGSGVASNHQSSCATNIYNFFQRKRCRMIVIGVPFD